MGGFEVKNFSYSYSLFKGNHSMESKIIEYGIILLHKYKVEKIEVISRLFIHFFTHKLQEHFVKENINIFLKHFYTSFTVKIKRVYEIFIQVHFESIQCTQSKCS